MSSDLVDEPKGAMLQRLLLHLGLPRTADALLLELTRKEGKEEADSKGVIETNSSYHLLESFVLVTDAASSPSAYAATIAAAAVGFLSFSGEDTASSKLHRKVALSIQEWLLLECSTSFSFSAGHAFRGLLWRQFVEFHLVVTSSGLMPPAAAASHLELLARSLFGEASSSEQLPTEAILDSNAAARTTRRRILTKLIHKPLLSTPSFSQSNVDVAPLDPNAAATRRLRRLRFISQLLAALDPNAGGSASRLSFVLSGLVAAVAAREPRADVQAQLQLQALRIAGAPNPLQALLDSPAIVALGCSSGSGAPPLGNPHRVAGPQISPPEPLVCAPRCILNFGLQADLSRRLLISRDASSDREVMSEHSGDDDDTSAAAAAESGMSPDSDQTADAVADESSVSVPESAEDSDRPEVVPEEPLDVAVSPCGQFWAIVTSKMRLILLSSSGKESDDPSLQVAHVVGEPGAHSRLRVDATVRFSQTDARTVAAFFAVGAAAGRLPHELPHDTLLVHGIGTVTPLRVSRHRLHGDRNCSGIRAACLIVPSVALVRKEEELLTASDHVVLRTALFGDPCVVLQSIRIPQCTDVMYSPLTESIYLLDARTGAMSVLDSASYDDVSDATPTLSRSGQLPGVRRQVDGERGEGTSAFAGTLLPVWDRGHATTIQQEEASEIVTAADAGSRLITAMAMRRVPQVFRTSKRSRSAGKVEPVQLISSGTRVTYIFPSADCEREPPHPKGPTAPSGMEYRQITGRTLLSFATHHNSLRTHRLLVLVAADDTARLSPVARPSRLLPGCYVAIVFDSVLGQAVREIAVCPLAPPSSFLRRPCAWRTAKAVAGRERIMLLRAAAVSCEVGPVTVLIGGPGHTLHIFDIESGRRIQTVDFGNPSTPLCSRCDDSDAAEDADIAARQVLRWAKNTIQMSSSPSCDDSAQALQFLRCSADEDDHQAGYLPSCTAPCLPGDLLKPQQDAADATPQLVTSLNCTGVVSGVAAVDVSQNGRLRVVCCDEFGLCFCAGFD